MVNRVKEYREQAGMTQQELADAVNISENHLSSIENGRKRLTYPLAVQIAHVLECETRKIFANHHNK